MRKYYFDLILELMEKNKDIYFISAGLGWPRTDELQARFPDRFTQGEASEQTCLDMAVGLAKSGKIPFVYTITPFYWRAAETIRTYIAHENYHVIMCGAGRDDDYKEDGFTHDGTDIKGLMDLLNIKCHFPGEKEELPELLNTLINNKQPHFLSLKR